MRKNQISLCSYNQCVTYNSLLSNETTGKFALMLIYTAQRKIRGGKILLNVLFNSSAASKMRH